MKKKYDWKHANIGDDVMFVAEAFDGKMTAIGKVTKIADDHIIVTADDMHLWVDDAFADMFIPIERS